jgi:hypothetical protein
VACGGTPPPRHPTNFLNCTMQLLHGHGIRRRPQRWWVACLWAMMLLIASGRAVAQATPISLGLQAGVSYSGWNLALVGQYHLDQVSAYLGPSISLNRGLPGRGPIGLCTGANLHIPSTKAWVSSLVNLDYQLHFFRAAGTEATAIHEVNVGYGLEFHVTEAFTIVQQLGVGGYLESNPGVPGGNRRNISGYNGLVRLRAGYRF